MCPFWGPYGVRFTIRRQSIIQRTNRRITPLVAEWINGPPDGLLNERFGDANKESPIDRTTRRINHLRRASIHPWANSSIDDRRFGESINAPSNASIHVLINAAIRKSFEEWYTGPTKRWIKEASTTQKWIANESLTEWKSGRINLSMNGCMHDWCKRWPIRPINTPVPIPNAHD